MCAEDIRDPVTFAIIGAAMTVHKELGHGFLEAVYQEALEQEFIYREIPYQRECDLPIFYRSQQLKTTYRSDFICYESIIVELKAISVELTGIDQSQILNYLKASKLSKALLFNFGRSSLEYKRQILTQH
jgi:GxxExxY protein